MTTTVTVVETPVEVTVQEQAVTANITEQTTAVTIETGGISDHGGLTGLSDDDHVQYLLKAGGTMTGDLVLAGDPDAALKAATKQYVDANAGAGDVDDLTTATGNAAEMLRVAAAGGLEYRTAAQVLADIGAVDKTGDTMTGALSIPGTGTDSERFGAGATAAGDNTVAIGNNANAETKFSIALGKNASATDNIGGIAIGYGVSATEAYSVVIGIGSISAGGPAIGREAQTTGAAAVALGDFAIASGNTVAIGNSADSNNSRCVAIGKEAKAPQDSTVVGFEANKGNTAKWVTTLGRSAGSAYNYSIALGYVSQATKANQFVIGSSFGPINEILAYTETALTAAIQDIYLVNHKSSGTPAAGFGAGLLYQLESSTTEDRDAARIAAEWNTATDATRKADLVLSAYDTAEREGVRIRGNGSAAAIGFLGATPQAVQDITGSRGGNAALANLLTALANLGLITDSTT